MIGNLTRHERVLEGERAILIELDAEKKKAATQKRDLLGLQYMSGSDTASANENSSSLFASLFGKKHSASMRD